MLAWKSPSYLSPLENKLGKETKGFWIEGKLFSKTSPDRIKIIKNVRQRPTLGGYNLKFQKKEDKYDNILNDNNSIPDSYRIYIKNVSNKKYIQSTNTLKCETEYNYNNDDTNDKTVYTINKMNHRYTKSNQI